MENIDLSNVNRTEFLLEQHFTGQQHHHASVHQASSLVLYEPTYNHSGFSGAPTQIHSDSITQLIYQPNLTLDSPEYNSDSLETRDSSSDSPVYSLNQMKHHPDQENFRHRNRNRRRKGQHQQVQQRHAANLRERRRMQSINDAFEVIQLIFIIEINSIQMPFRGFVLTYQLFLMKNAYQKLIH